MKSYQIVNPSGQVESRFQYVNANPLNVRFNGQTGRFNIDGVHDIGTSLTLIPMAWRIFEGEFFGRSYARYLELYFVMKGGNVACVMFTNTSVQIFEKFMASLVYEKRSITETEITITPAKRINKTNNSTYHVAEFNGQPANPRAVQMLRDFAEDHTIYRGETTAADSQVHSPGYRTALTYEQSKRLTAHEVQAAWHRENGVIGD